jgi:hypothetical protein
MAILLEAINVVIKDQSLENKCKGGYIGLLMDITRLNLPWHTDCELFRIGFMGPDTLHNFLPVLEERGLKFTEDWCIVDMMSGPTKPCNWLGFGRQMFFKNGSNVGVSFDSYSIAWLKSQYHSGLVCNDSNEYTIATPESWDFKNAISNIHNIPGDTTRNVLIGLGLPNGMVPFVDENNNQVSNPKPWVSQI